jgi:hypothetical protein
MRRIALLLVLGACGCGKEAEQAAQQPPAQAPRAAAAAAPMAPQSSVAGAPATMKPAMLEVPKDKSQLQRMLAMGYTVHEDHMHPPGVKECPFNMGGSIVQ